MIEKVDLLFTPNSQYEVLNYFTVKLKEAFDRKGYKTKLWHPEDSAFKQILEEPADLTISFNGSPSSKGKLLPEITGKPFLSLLVDPFYRFMYLFNKPNVFVGCDDYINVSLLKQMQFENVGFIPHAVEKDFKIENSEKIFDVIFFATFIDYEKRRLDWVENYPKSIAHMMDEIVEEAFFSTKSFMEIAFSKFATEELLKKDTIDWRNVLADIEIYLKGRERVELLRSITNHKVHVFGNSIDKISWHEYFENQKNVATYPPVSYKESLSLLNQSKIVLNSSLKNKFGAHERVFSSYLAGAIPVTNRNDYLESFFTNDLDILFFDTDNLKNIEERIEYFLKSPQLFDLAIDTGKKIVLENHTWDNRVDAILNNFF